ncbi:MAG: HflC protein [Candidatus Marinimicrobia bacterium]|nr:HflC protein [Candidatus Neomarinimicrobiota bacterium]|tara:strand:- start:1146 stop:2078 length:933 start_codon:yes stop_codon:yes gene_type:complete
MKLNSYMQILFVAFIVILSNAFYIVNEKEQAIVTQFGKPVGDAKINSGLYLKIPFVQTILKFDRRILEWDGAANEIPTKDNKYIFIDTFARWKISNPLQFYKSAKNEILAQSRLDDVIDGAVRDEISNRFMSEIIRSSKRKMEVYETQVDNQSMEEEILKEGARKEIIVSILNSVQQKLEELNIGISVVDVQIKRVSYNRQVQDKLFNRMISEQNMIAEKYRAQGEGRKQEILGKQIQKEKELISKAYLESQEIIGRADAKAMDVYAKAYSKDPEFYNYYKTLETYKETLDPSTLFILSTNNKFLKFIEK